MDHHQLVVVVVVVVQGLPFFLLGQEFAVDYCCWSSCLTLALFFGRFHTGGGSTIVLFLLHRRVFSFLVEQPNVDLSGTMHADAF